ncbi:MAG: ABC transporter ATP-binding protein [Lachnospiraceae bacterium]|nr:ABC transporter ATP-binding protein [Lachnospiraceae bacterium]
MLKLEKITIKYKKKIVLENVDFFAGNGEIVGLLGSNGSGKSTLLSAIAGAKRATFGKMYIDDMDFEKNTDEYRKNIGYVPQENPLIAELTALDNLRIWSDKSKEELKEIISEEPLSLLGVSEFCDRKVSSLSGGMKKRLSITATLITSPQVLLMDEPFAALDMVAKHDILQYMSTFKANGGIMIVASHEETVLDYCDRIYFIKNGQVTELDKSSDKSYIDLLRGRVNVG